MMDKDALFHPARKLPGFDDLGLFEGPKGVVRLVRNQRTGVVMELTHNGSLRGVAPAVAALVHGAPQGEFSAYTSSFAPASFDACATLIRSTAGPVQAAARSVLVDGLTQAEACRLHGATQQNVSRTIAAFRRAMELAVVAVQGGR